MSCILLAVLYSKGISFVLPFVAHILPWAAGGGDGSAGKLRRHCAGIAFCVSLGVREFGEEPCILCLSQWLFCIYIHC